MIAEVLYECHMIKCARLVSSNLAEHYNKFTNHQLCVNGNIFFMKG